MNTTKIFIPVKGPEDFYAYRVGLKVQAYGGALIIAFGILGEYNLFMCTVVLKNLDLH